MIASDSPRTLRWAICALTKASRLSRRVDWALLCTSGVMQARIGRRSVESGGLMIGGVCGEMTNASAATGAGGPTGAEPWAFHTSRRSPADSMIPHGNPQPGDDVGLTLPHRPRARRRRQRLGVRHVLEGSVRKAGPWLRITAQLTGARDGYTVRSERFDREIDVFALQDELAGAIAGKLQLSLLAPSDAAPRAGPRNVEAYELMLKGRVLLGQRGRAIVDAIPCFERSVQLDPALVEGWALLADSY